MMVKLLLLSLMVMATMLAMGDAARQLKNLCKVSKPPVMTDFCPHRYAGGVWYLTHVMTDHPPLKDSLNSRTSSTFDPAANTFTTDIAIYYKNGSCKEFDKVYKVKNGVMTNETVSGDTRKKVVKTMLKTDYDSIAVLLMEFYFDGKINHDRTNIFLKVRDPSKEPNFSVVADTLKSFCGDNAGTIKFFRSLNVNVTKTCGDF